MNRREFIKLSGLMGAGAVLPPTFLSGCSEHPLPGSGQVSVTPTICDICFWKCAALVYQENSKPWKIVGNKDDLHSKGVLCTRGTGGLATYNDPDRLKRPLIRTNDKGKQGFQEVSWETALDFIADRMKRIAEAHGADRLALFSHGSGGAHFKHLLKAFGCGSFAAPSFAQCRGPRDVAFRQTFGECPGSPERTDMANSRCIVLIGSHIGENLHNGQVQTLAEAINNNATLITVDPRFSVAASKSRYWLPIKPGTDLALLLAWMHVIINDGCYDRDYVQRYTYGFDELRRHVQAFTPEWAYLETGLRPALIRETALEMAKNAPATLVHPGRHVTWYGDDTQRVRAIAILNALLGSWGRKGGFYTPETVDLPKFPVPGYPVPESTVQVAKKGKYPLARQGLTNAVVDSSIGSDSHYKGWFVYGTNLPMVMPGIRPKLEQAANSLDLIVVIDILPMEITGYADVILPECTYLERYDDLRNSQEREPSLALRAPVFKPKYDSKPGWWIAKQIGERLKLGDYFPWEDYAEVLNWQLQQLGSSLQEMREVGVKTFPRKQPLYFSNGEDIRFETSTGKIELYSTKLAKYGFDPMPKYTPPEEPPEGYFRLNYGRVPAHTGSRTTNNALLFELIPENTLWVNPLVASQWGLKNGEYVRLKNTDGIVSNRIRVRVTERIRPDSVFMAHGFGHSAKRMRLTNGIGADDTALMTNVKVDPIMGATGMRANFVTFVKEAI